LESDWRFEVAVIGEAFGPFRLASPALNYPGYWWLKYSGPYTGVLLGRPAPAFLPLQLWEGSVDVTREFSDLLREGEIGPD